MAGTKSRKTAKSVKNKTVDNMKKLGTYKPEYDKIIEIYADLCEQYDILTRQFIESGMSCESSTESGGTKKSAVIATLENLRKDILQYSDRLCLNPKSLETVTVENKAKSKLAEALSELTKNEQQI